VEWLFEMKDNIAYGNLARPVASAHIGDEDEKFPANANIDIVEYSMYVLRNRIEMLRLEGSRARGFIFAFGNTYDCYTLVTVLSERSAWLESSYFDMTLTINGWIETLSKLAKRSTAYEVARRVACMNNSSDKVYLKASAEPIVAKLLDDRLSNFNFLLTYSATHDLDPNHPACSYPRAFESTIEIWKILGPEIVNRSESIIPYINSNGKHNGNLYNERLELVKPGCWLTGSDISPNKLLKMGTERQTEFVEMLISDRSPKGYDSYYTHHLTELADTFEGANTIVSRGFFKDAGDIQSIIEGNYVEAAKDYDEYAEDGEDDESLWEIDRGQDGVYYTARDPWCSSSDEEDVPYDFDEYGRDYEHSQF
jgi:hypothetical protein